MLFLIYSLALVSIIAWLIPRQFGVVIIIALTVVAGITVKFSLASIAVILILVITGFQYLKKNASRNSLLRINILLITFWALILSLQAEGALSWLKLNYFVLNSAPTIFASNLTSVLVALLLVIFLYHNRGGDLRFGKYNRGLYNLGLIILAIIVVVSYYLFADKLKLTTDLLALFLLVVKNEVIYHMLLQNWLYQITWIKSKEWALWLPIIIISVLYALFHWYFGLWVILIVFLSSVVMGYCYQRTGHIQLTIVIHLIIRLLIGIC